MKNKNAIIFTTKNTKCWTYFWVKKMKKEKFVNILKTSFLEGFLKKGSFMRDKEFEKHKRNSMKISVFVLLFCWLLIGATVKNIILALGLGIMAGITALIILLQLPLIQKKSYSRKVEAELPLFLIQLSTEISLGKSFQKAIKDSCGENGFASKEFNQVVRDMEKGMSFQEALQKMNNRLNSLNIRRANSNLSNLQLQGTRDVSGLKKLAQELLLKQRIESKEFSGKMVVYSLVFIAVSAIVPAMFNSFMLIGSYFMSISFTAQQVFLISVLVFPLIDAAILLMIDKKTPLFLKQ
jgi:flagellar protein FlaJ